MLETRVRVINARMVDIDRSDKNIILEYARECFGFEQYEEQFFVRGRFYGDIM